MATVAAPPSKSFSHRAVIAAALARGTSRLTGLLDSQDITRTRACMAAMGADFHPQSDGSLIVSGVAGRPQGGDPEGDAPALLDVGESGTTCRLLVAVAAAGTGVFEVRGEGRMHDRPIGELVRALLPLGVEILYLEKSGCPPLHIAARGLRGGEAAISLEDSSQYLSGLLLAAPMAAAPLTINISGQKTVSWPYVAITLSMLADFGVPFAVETLEGDEAWKKADWRALTDVVPGRTRFVMQPAPYTPREHVVEGDWSSASYFLAAGAVGREPVTVTGLRPDSLQGDRAILDILAAMDARIDVSPEGVTVLPSGLSGRELDMGRCPDLVPTVAAAACFASGETVIRNVAHLRLKESDRIEAVAENCTQAGAVVTTTADGMRIRPKALRTDQRVEFSSFNDHRLAMSAALFELAGIDVVLDNPGCVAKSFPTFWEKWATIEK